MLNYLTNIIALILVLFSLEVSASHDKLLNVSFDSTRELFDEINASFAKEYKKKYGKRIKIYQSHGASGKQVNAILHGLKADIITLSSEFDIDKLAKNGYLNENWRQYHPNHSSPYQSTIVLLVRKDNPKKIHDWIDLTKPGVEVVTANPKTSGGAVWSYLAILSSRINNSTAEQNNLITQIYQNVKILDHSIRNAAITFTERKIGDVYIAWENDALSIIEKNKKDEYEIIQPSSSIIINLPVAILEKNTKNHSATYLAKEYINFLYSQEAHDIFLRHHFRPTNTKLDLNSKQGSSYKIKYYTINELGKWQDLYQTHFASNGFFDQIRFRK